MKQCSGLVHRFWQHLNENPETANHRVEHEAKGFWIGIIPNLVSHEYTHSHWLAKEMRKFEELKGIDDQDTSDESEYDVRSVA